MVGVHSPSAQGQGSGRSLPVTPKGKAKFAVQEAGRRSGLEKEKDTLQKPLSKGTRRVGCR